MNIQGTLYAESPIYRGNSRKTLFTRDGDGTHRLVSLAGEVGGTAQSLMDAFIGQDRKGKNTGLLNQLWKRLYGKSMPDRLITQVTCTLQKSSYPRDNLFDLRMGIRLDEDRWAAESNANYKMETLFRHSAFDFTLSVNDGLLKKDGNDARLYYLFQELIAGRFWFGAGKSKGLGRLRLEMDTPLSVPATLPEVNPGANHLRLRLAFDSVNPVLVGWNWGKIDPESPSFAAVEGRLLVNAMRELPDAVGKRLAMSLGGPILSPENWKHKFIEQLPRVLAIWIQEASQSEEQECWVLPEADVKKLGKGKYKLSKKILEKLYPLTEKTYANIDDAEAEITEAMADKENMIKRVVKLLEQQQVSEKSIGESLWAELSALLSLAQDSSLKAELEEALDDEQNLVKILKPACERVFPRLSQQIDHQISLLQSDSWVDEELEHRRTHVDIKQMLMNGEISEGQWRDFKHPPKGVSHAAWREFLDAHRRVKYHHITHGKNLKKSITNDENMIAFLKSYRSQTRQELAQSYNIDFRAGGASNREISRKYGKPYDTVFMRMLSWAPSTEEHGAWEVYIPGSTIKGAFRKRASQVLKTLLGESSKTRMLIDKLFGAQGKRGMMFFSDAYLSDPVDPEKAWCSMDGVKMDPKNGKPLESAKRDFLYAYGKELAFQCQIDIQDVRSSDLEAFSVFLHLLDDFRRGDIPLGGEKTSGFGWIKADLQQVEWLSAEQSDISQKLFPGQTMKPDGIWQSLVLDGDAALQALQSSKESLSAEQNVSKTSVPRAKAGFISHKAFGGYCGMLYVEADVLTPVTVQESGEPSFRQNLAEGPVNGWDFFSMSPPEASKREDKRRYALPSKSLRGMLRHIYAVASDSREESKVVTDLNPADSLFGWVGRGQNQAIMGRVSVSFGYFQDPQLSWFAVPYPYGNWQFQNGQWKEVSGTNASKLRIQDTWRIFPHAPLAPVAKQVETFAPDTVQSSYFRAILPGHTAQFSIRFWNLEEEELQRVIWTIALEPELAHKMGKHRYLGFGSLRLRILPESYLIDWEARYQGKTEKEWQKSLSPDEWRNTRVIAHYADLRKALNAAQL